MDVVGGVIVAAQSGKGAGGGGGRHGGGGGGGGGEERTQSGRGVKRAAPGSCCGGDYGGLSLGGGSWESLWTTTSSHHQQRRVSPRREGADRSTTEVERDDYELRSVLIKSASLNGTSSSSSGSSSTSHALGRLARSSSCSLGLGDHGGAFENTRALLAPFYCPTTNPVFVKPLPARSWVDPLRSLLKKELTVTDVGELGRIILPKRDAECQLPHLDSKEGKLLSMEDYNSNKHWTLRYKWWPNNKSRMYVLESTGEFVKYHDLKEKDELIVYKDGVGNLVIRGQKWSSSNPLLRNDSSFLTPSGSFKAKSTGKRSPKGANARANARSSPTGVTSISTSTVTTNPTQMEASTGFQVKLESSPQSPKLLHPLDCGLLPSSVLATSVLSTSVLNVEMGSSSYPGGNSDGVIDWEKLPDPPALEFTDPPTIEFPGEFECTWGDCI